MKSTADTRLVVQEALWVVKPGGSFSFIDHFYEENHYGKKEEFEKFLKGLGLSYFEYKSIGEWIDLPVHLKHPKILGNGGIFYGRN